MSQVFQYNFITQEWENKPLKPITPEMERQQRLDQALAQLKPTAQVFGYRQLAIFPDYDADDGELSLFEDRFALIDRMDRAYATLRGAA